jgi:hypothetical protein
LPTLHWFPDAELVVNSCEADDYRRRAKSVLVVPDVEGDDRAAKRNYILAEARRRGLAYFVMADDDVESLYRQTPSGYVRAEDGGEAALAAMLCDLQEGCVVSTIGHRWPYIRTQYRESRGIVRQLFAVNLRLLPEDVTFWDSPIFHDLEFTMQLLLRGLRYRERHDVVMDARFGHYRQESFDVIGRLERRYGPGCVVVKLYRDGSLRYVGPNYAWFDSMRRREGLLSQLA